MDLPVSDLLQILGVVFAAIGVWYKSAQDTDKKISDAREASSIEIAKVKTELAEVRATAISRTEHDHDIDLVKQEIRVFRDEVREDIRSLSTQMTARFDLLIQKMSFKD